MIWLLSYVASNYALIIAVTLCVLAMAAIAWFSKNWKVGVAAVAVLIAGLAYQQIDHNAYSRAQAEQSSKEIKLLKDWIKNLESANEADAQRAAADTAALDALRERASQTPANDAACLPEDAAKRVGDIR